MFVLDVRTANVHYPGIGRYTFELARALAAITELTLLHNPLQNAPDMDVFTIPAKRVAVPHTPRSLEQQWVVRSHLQRLNATLYHSPFYLMPFAPGVPTVVTAYDLIPLKVRDGFTPRQLWLYKVAHQLAFNAAEHILTLSQAARTDFIAQLKLPPQIISSVVAGLPPHIQPQAASAVQSFREKYHLPEKYLLYVGSNKPHKNLPALIQAYGTLPAHTPPLVIAGPEDERFPEMRRAAETLGERVRVLGRLPDSELPAAYSGAELYVQASKLEGFGFPVLEAMACGAPVACSEIAVLREMAQSAAVYFDPTSPASMAQTLQETLESPSLLIAMRERGQQRACYFTWERAAAQTLEIYKQIAGS
jgi:alpha-1,3-rhamnosyl/mannosyltransferase